MKIILIDSLTKLGKIGDIVEVKNGYGKNYLIPSKKAIHYSVNNYKTFEEKKHEFEAKSSDKLNRANNTKSLLDNKNIIIIENASDDGRLYGSVNSSAIVNKINEVLGSKIVDKSELNLSKPIKEIGIYSAKLNLHSDLSIDIKLVVSRSDSEALAMLNPKKKAKEKEVSAENVATETEDKSLETENKPAKKTRSKKSEKNN
jgi:large subunit ribosomal protein L9